MLQHAWCLASGCTAPPLVRLQHCRLWGQWVKQRRLPKRKASGDRPGGPPLPSASLPPGLVCAKRGRAPPRLYVQKRDDPQHILLGHTKYLPLQCEVFSIKSNFISVWESDLHYCAIMNKLLENDLKNNNIIVYSKNDWLIYRLATFVIVTSQNT